MDRSVGGGSRARRTRAGARAARCGPRRGGAQRSGAQAWDSVRQHDPGRARARAARRPGGGATAALARSAGTRWPRCCRPTRSPPELGGHIASYQSAATLYEIGFNHFWHAPGGARRRPRLHPGPLVAGHLRARLPGGAASTRSACGTSARMSTGGGLSSYPHPWLMPDFWQFPTVSMGLGPDDGDLPGALHEVPAGPRARARPRGARCGPSSATARWTSPESMGAISLAGRERLDNLVFVVNCNLQRLDGPVRGNGKIIQELETNFRGAGWNVIKVIWGSRWDQLLGRGPRRPAAQAHGGGRRRRLPDLQGARRRVRARALLRRLPGAARASSTT